MKKSGRAYMILAGGVALFLLACWTSPEFDRAALDGVSLPAMSLMHRLTAPVPFPVAEVAAIALAAVLTFALLTSLTRPDALRRWLRGTAWTALLLGGLLALLWGPARLRPKEPISAPDADELAWLCEYLIDDLNASPLAFPEVGDALRLAPEVAGGSAVAVKAARYPEWMDACRIWGLFIPLTGEALADPDAPRALLPFTTVHELTHLNGIADEGAANVAAWQCCMEVGGPFADSARLWALRYAMGLLREGDPVAWRSVTAKMEGPLTRTFLESGGEADPAAGMRDTLTGDYAALAAFLAAEGGLEGSPGARLR